MTRRGAWLGTGWGAMLAFAATLALAPADARATIIWNVDQDVFCSEDPGDTICTTDKLAGEARFDFFDDGGQVRLDLTLTNQSTFDTSRLTAVAFNLASDFDTVAGDNLPTSGFALDLAPSVPMRSEVDDVCITSTAVGPPSSPTPNCIAGDPNDGLGQGQSALFQLFIDPDPDLSAADYEANFTPNPITFRFMAINDVELGFIGQNGDVSIVVGGSTTDVPEPGTLALLGVGLLGLGVVARRRFPH